MTALPAGWQMLPTSLDDIDRIVAVVGGAEQSLGRPIPFDAARLRALVTMPLTDIGRDGRLLVDRSGADVASVWVRGEPPWGTAHVHLAVLPHPDQQVAARASVAEALTILQTRPEFGPQCTVTTSVAANDRPLLSAFAEAGFVEVRRARTMERALDDPVPAPVWPDGISVASWRVTDRQFLSEVAAVDAAAFADHDGDYVMSEEAFVHYVTQVPSVLPDLSLVAVREGRVVGLTLVERAGAQTEGGAVYFSAVAVLRAERGRGVARALLLESFARCRAAGAALARLDVQVGNRTGADRLYQSVGMNPVSESVDLERPLPG